MITSGEDKTICIWDSSFNQISEFPIADFVKCGSKDNPHENVSAQSLDLFCCRRKRDLSQANKQATNQPILLVGTRNGDILEAKLDISFDGNYEIDSEADSDEEDQPKQKSLKIVAQWDSLLRCHSSTQFNPIQDDSMQHSRKVYMAIHPKFDIMFTVGDDCYLKIWNTKDKKWRFQKFLGERFTPTSIAIHPAHGDILMIGFVNGQILQYESNIRENMSQGLPGNDYILPDFKAGTHYIKNVHKPNTAVLSIVFSNDGVLMAASYGNLPPLTLQTKTS